MLNIPALATYRGKYLTVPANVPLVGVILCVEFFHAEEAVALGHDKHRTLPAPV